MNQQQRRYFQKRIKEVQDEKLREARDKRIQRGAVNIRAEIVAGNLIPDVNNILEFILYELSEERRLSKNRYGGYRIDDMYVLDPGSLNMNLDIVFPNLKKLRDLVKAEDQDQVKKLRNREQYIIQKTNDATDQAMLGESYEEVRMLLESLASL